LQLYKIITRSGLLDARDMELPQDGAGLFICFLIGVLVDIFEGKKREVNQSDGVR
jgi:hypothetical protein